MQAFQSSRLVHSIAFYTSLCGTSNTSYLKLNSPGFFSCPIMLLFFLSVNGTVHIHPITQARNLNTMSYAISTKFYHFTLSRSHMFYYITPVSAVVKVLFSLYFNLCMCLLTGFPLSNFSSLTKVLHVSYNPGCGGVQSHQAPGGKRARLLTKYD